MKKVADSHRPGRFEFGLYRDGHVRGSVWVQLRLRWWFGLEVRWDPDLIGSKLMWSFGKIEVGWLE